MSSFILVDVPITDKTWPSAYFMSERLLANLALKLSLSSVPSKAVGALIIGLISKLVPLRYQDLAIAGDPFFYVCHGVLPSVTAIAAPNTTFFWLEVHNETEGLSSVRIFYKALGNSTPRPLAGIAQSKTGFSVKYLETCWDAEKSGSVVKQLSDDKIISEDLVIALNSGVYSENSIIYDLGWPDRQLKKLKVSEVSAAVLKLGVLLDEI